MMRSLLPAALAVVLAGLPAAAEPVSGATASAWKMASNSQVRLILPDATSRIEPGTMLTGAIEIRLDPGAKTYWRTPGTTGIPPVIKFGESESLSAIAVEFPAPRSFDDGAGGRANGYFNSVLLPVRFRTGMALEGGKAAIDMSSKKARENPPASPRLAVDLEYGVCLSNMCVPAQVTVSLRFGEGIAEPGLAARVEAAVKAIPVKQKFGGNEPIGLASVRAAKVDGKRQITVVARFPSGVTFADLFIEGSVPYTVRPLGQAIAGAQQFIATPDQDPGDKLGMAKFTLVTPQGAIEVPVDLDAAAK